MMTVKCSPGGGKRRCVKAERWMWFGGSREEMSEGKDEELALTTRTSGVERKIEKELYD
jgi:hypothetical protein